MVVLFEHEHTFISKLQGKRSYFNHPKRILDDTLPTIHGFPPYLAADKTCYENRHICNAPLEAHLRNLISLNQ